MEETRKGVAARLRLLAIGETIVFPMEQITTVKTTVGRLRREQRRLGWDAEVYEDTAEYCVIVKRVK